MQSSHLDVLRQPEDLRARSRAWKASGKRVALVPTMGALHKGHLSLVDAARERSSVVVVSIFVNPTQFAPHEDFDRYPRTEDRDLELLRGQGAASAAYIPTARDMYPPGFSTSVSLSGPSVGLESESRPHFFTGVATVVCKLLLQCEPDLAVFGEKDFQQLAVIRRMAGDLDIPVEIVGCPTLRERDGLAMSSRNAYLSTKQRKIAGQLNRIMLLLAKEVRDGAEVLSASARARAQLLEAGFDSVDYVEVRDAETLSPSLRSGHPKRVLVTARLGAIRLLDNCAV
jgi:pantoate--beta-alanine ligase